MIKEAIILAGGLGTRLKDTVPDLPKCMAPVAGRPFLFYLINQLRLQGIERIVFSLGFKYEIVENYLAEQFSTLDYETVIEHEPLGTGGALVLACQKTKEQHVLIANGDTLYRANIQNLGDFHLTNHGEATLALKPMNEFDRFGTVETESNGRVKKFVEKKYCSHGNINGGLFILDVPSFLKNSWPAKFSFEKEYLEKGNQRLFANVQDAYFIDIGIPEDFVRAQAELKQLPLDLKSIDSSWSLFLDRDGVINVDKEGSYIFHTSEFNFTEGAPTCFKKTADIFKYNFVVTNQRGVGRELMTEQALRDIHQHMVTAIRNEGGRIDQIYYCTAINNDHPQRKPNPGMARQAVLEFPGIDLSRSIMVGNNPGDMAFGKNAGMYTVFIRSTRPNQQFPHPDIDLIYNTLSEFVDAL